MVNATTAQPPGSTDDKPSKKQKQKDQSADTQSDSIQKEKKRKKKHHKEASVSEATEVAHVTDEGGERPAKKQKKDEPEQSVPEDQQNTSPENASPKKPKREKRPKKPKDKSKKHKEEVPNPKDKIEIADIPVPYTNPLTDNTLSDFAQRGLAYAYQYVQHISLTSDSERAAKRAWKFNKARQNWILRHITDPSVIPESYLPLSLIYINSIQGGARDELKKTCKRIKKQAKASKAAPTNEQNAPKLEVDQSSGAKDRPVKNVTFAVGTAEPATADPVTAEPAMTEPEASPPSKVKVKRAKTIIKVLKGKIQPQEI